MRLGLSSTILRFSFLGACLVCAGMYVHLALHAYRASRFASVPELENLQRAIELEPSNAEYRELLGRNQELSVQNVDSAISNYQIAVRLNPYDASYWLDLANAYQIAGRFQEQAEAVRRAVQADPMTPHIAWEAANFFLVQGNQEEAFRNFRVVLAEDPEAVDAALQISWRATQDATVMLQQVVPPRSDVYFSLLRLLIWRNETAASEKVWDGLLALNQPFSVSQAFPYFRFLLANQEVALAQAAWRNLAVLDSSLQPYLPSADNLIVNGGFEENLLNGGFDWWYQPYSQVALSIDTSEFHSGSRSLSVTFDGRSTPEAGISQFIPLKPNTDYEFTGEYRSEDLDTASGPRFSIADPYSNTSYVLTDDALGSNPWRSQRAQFHTGPNTNLVVLKIVRVPAAPLIRGRFWIDDLKLVEKKTGVPEN